MRDPTGRPRLVAGTSAGERQPPTRRGPEPDWYLPAHARSPNAVRQRQAAQVAAGADVLLAQTYLTHRRSLSRVGEARRARELTHAAIAVARSAIEQALETRPSPLGEVLVAGVLPAIGEDAESGSGRLLPRDEATQQDLDAHAGMLAEGGVDLVVVEAGRSMASTLAGAAAVRSVDLPAWVVIPADQPQAIEELALYQPAVYLVAGGMSAEELVRSTVAHPSLGIWLTEPSPPDGLAERMTGWLDAGAEAIALADGATPEVIEPMAAAIGDFVAHRATRRSEAGRSWSDWLSAGARLAPGGAAAWLSAAGGAENVPSGWAWDMVAPEDARLLPAERYRLAVVAQPDLDVDLDAVHRALQRGGVLVAALVAARPLPAGLAIVDMREIDGRRWLTLRRAER